MARRALGRATTMPKGHALAAADWSTWYGAPLEDEAESFVTAADEDDVRVVERLCFTRPGHYDEKRIRERRILNGRSEEMPSLAEAVTGGLAELHEREAVERAALEQRQAHARAAQEREDRMRAQALTHRRIEWAKRGRAGLVADLTAVGWRVDATDLNRLVLRRGEGMLALSLPFSPADACELEDRHGWAFLPWL